MFVPSTKRKDMKWYPLGQPEEKPLENEMLWTSLACKAQEVDGQTFLHCRYVSKPKYLNGGWINIYESTYLVNADTRDMLPMVQAYNVPIGPAKHHFKEPGQLKQFTLLFPKVPKHWKRFHLLEMVKGADGFKVMDIVRNDTGVYHIQLT
jgi:hypothetical protein